MKPAFPLYVRILTWFFVNLIVVALAGWLWFREQFRLPSLSAKAASGNLERAAGEITGAAHRPGAAALTALLEEAGRRHGVEFRICSIDGRVLAGPAERLPPAVHQPWFAAARRQGEAREPIPPPLFPDGAGPPPPRRPTLPPGTVPDPDRFREILQSTQPQRYWAALPLRENPPGISGEAVLVASSDSPTGHGFYIDIWPYLAGGLGVLGISVLVWLPFVRGLTRSLSRLGQSTRRIAEGDLSVRTDVQRRDEVGALAVEINRMAGQLDTYVSGQKRFLRDAAHELSAPVARLQMALEILGNRLPAGEADRVADIREEVEHMAHLVQELLQFSRASMTAEASPPAALSLQEMVDAAVRLENAGPEAVSVSVAPDLRVLGRRDALIRAIGNTVRNALRYAGHAGPVEISAARENGTVRLDIQDRGPGIPAEALPDIFKPFYRIDTARTPGVPGTGGTGLGLAIVLASVEACGGRVSALNRPGGGLQVTITLQEAPAGSA